MFIFRALDNPPTYTSKLLQPCHQQGPRFFWSGLFVNSQSSHRNDLWAHWTLFKMACLSSEPEEVTWMKRSSHWKSYVQINSINTGKRSKWPPLLSLKLSLLPEVLVQGFLQVNDCLCFHSGLCFSASCQNVIYCKPHPHSSSTFEILPFSRDCSTNCKLYFPKQLVSFSSPGWGMLWPLTQAVFFKVHNSPLNLCVPHPAVY